MPDPIKVMNKIRKLAEIAVEEYEISEEVMKKITENAFRINHLYIRVGFKSTDVFLAEDGAMSVSAYKNDGCIRVLAENNDRFNIIADTNRKLLYYKQNLTRYEVFLIMLRYFKKFKDKNYE